MPNPTGWASLANWALPAAFKPITASTMYTASESWTATTLPSVEQRPTHSQPGNFMPDLVDCLLAFLTKSNIPFPPQSVVDNWIANAGPPLDTVPVLRSERAVEGHAKDTWIFLVLKFMNHIYVAMNMPERVIEIDSILKFSQQGDGELITTKGMNGAELIFSKGQVSLEAKLPTVLEAHEAILRTAIKWNNWSQAIDVNHGSIQLKMGLQIMHNPAPRIGLETGSYGCIFSGKQFIPARIQGDYPNHFVEIGVPMYLYETDTEPGPIVFSVCAMLLEPLYPPTYPVAAAVPHQFTTSLLPTIPASPPLSRLRPNPQGQAGGGDGASGNGSGSGNSGGRGAGRRRVGRIGSGDDGDVLVEAEVDKLVHVQYTDPLYDPTPRPAIRVHFEPSGSLPIRENMSFRQIPKPSRMHLDPEWSNPPEVEGPSEHLLSPLSLVQRVASGRTCQVWRVGDHSSSESASSSANSSFDMDKPTTPQTASDSSLVWIPKTQTSTTLQQVLGNLSSLVSDSPPPSTFMHKVDPNNFDLVAKVQSAKFAAYVARETIMYEEVLERRTELKGYIPRFFGTFMSPCGGWFVTLMEDVGESLESSWPQEQHELRELEEVQEALRYIGIEHGDWRPANVAKNQYGEFVALDFGYSYFI
ncbi:hypothetical protein T439DRAFT_384616 [Meredithblackwellia eburnea MCA 4105]